MVALPVIGQPAISASRIASFARCPRYWHHKYIDRRVPREVDETDVIFGKAVHVGLATWYGGSSPAECVRTALAEIPISFARKRNTVEAILRGYFTRYAEKDGTWTVLGVEVPFRLEVAGGVPVTGAIDLVVRTPSGKTLIVEHKTVRTASLVPSSDIWERRARDLQWQIYVLAWQGMGNSIDGVVYNLVRQPLLRTRRAETAAQLTERIVESVTSPDGLQRHYGRMVVPFGETQLREAAADIQGWHTMMKQTQAAGVSPRNTEACAKFGRPCEYASTCHGDTAITDDEMYMNKERGE
jgi:hypothetical protein